MNKKSILIIFGGNSTEHNVSCKSVMNFIKNIPDNKYEKHLVGIKKNGDWVYYSADTSLILQCKWADEPSNISCMLCPGKGLVLLDNENTTIKIDTIIPVLHGKNGEDGTIQGLFELCSIPYVGCGVVSSGVSMDKAYTKIIVDSLKTIPQANYVLVKEGDSDSYIENAEKTLGYPMFVKPCKSGSSQGVSKAENRTELINAVNLALKHDSKVLIEETIKGRELECAVLEKNGKIVCSNAGEAVAGDVFYSYEAKYNNADSKTVLNPDIPEGVNEKVREYAEAIFKALGCNGLSRVDFFMEENGNVIFNEINTLPGFTEISMYPMMMEAVGYPIEKLMEELIEGAGISK
ncbi:MAG: D-alanine--D-alanine ligase [Clostridia bacterium]|nr:D-alanine--D-alanine ligase [Clostridia bacterium]